MDEMRDPLTEKIIGCAYAVSNVLGCGYLEKVYENALALELRACGLTVEAQRPLAVRYKGQIVGEYQTDLIVENEVIVELKAAKSIDDSHMAQCLNYLKTTGYRKCLLLNFGTARIGIKRISL
jgi:GxxExxY protein